MTLDKARNLMIGVGIGIMLAAIAVGSVSMAVTGGIMAITGALLLLINETTLGLTSEQEYDIVKELEEMQTFSDQIVEVSFKRYAETKRTEDLRHCSGVCMAYAMAQTGIQNILEILGVDHFFHLGRTPLEGDEGYTPRQTPRQAPAEKDTFMPFLSIGGEVLDEEGVLVEASSVEKDVSEYSRAIPEETDIEYSRGVSSDVGFSRGVSHRGVVPDGSSRPVPAGIGVPVPKGPYQFHDVLGGGPSKAPPSDYLYGPPADVPDVWVPYNPAEDLADVADDWAGVSNDVSPAQEGDTIAPSVVGLVVDEANVYHISFDPDFNDWARNYKVPSGLQLLFITVFDIRDESFQPYVLEVS